MRWKNGRAVKVHAVRNLPCKVGHKQNFPYALSCGSFAEGGECQYCANPRDQKPLVGTYQPQICHLLLVSHQ